jgi:hypothetical protein
MAKEEALNGFVSAIAELSDLSLLNSFVKVSRKAVDAGLVNLPDNEKRFTAIAESPAGVGNTGSGDT